MIALRSRCALGAAATLCGTAFAALTALPVFAVGYAGTPAVPAPQGSFPTTVTSATVDAGSATALSSGAVSLQVPDGALPAGTQVSVLQGNQAMLQALLPAGSSYLDGFAVGWTAPDGSTPVATAPLTFIVTDSRVTTADQAFSTTATGLTSTTASIATGHASFTFTDDPGFVLATAAATATVPNGPGNAGGGAASTPGGSSIAPAPLALAAIAGAILAALGVFVPRRRRLSV